VIYYLVTADHAYTISAFARSWTRWPVGRVAVWPYERRPWLRPVEPGAYVFSDLERLTDAEREQAGRLHARVAARDGVRALNDPARSLRRFALLERLHDEGINDFRAYRATESWSGCRFPVFVRAEHAHGGSLTDRLGSVGEVEAAIRRIEGRGRFRRDDLLVVEFSDTVGEDGIYRKYSVLRVDGALIPRHVFFSRSWITNMADLVDERWAAEESEFLDRFPHRDQIARVFELARLEYGRIDYAVRNGRVIVWEINTNPVIVLPPDEIAPARLPGQRRSADLITRALERLDADLPPTAAPSRVRCIGLGARSRVDALVRLVRRATRTKRP